MPGRDSRHRDTAAATAAGQPCPATATSSQQTPPAQRPPQATARREAFRHACGRRGSPSRGSGSSRWYAAARSRRTRPMEPRPVALSGVEIGFSEAQPPPPDDLRDPGGGEEARMPRERAGPRQALARRSAARPPSSTSARRREQQIAERRQRRVPGLDRFQRGVDHRRAVDGDDGKPAPSSPAASR